jgi:hypothetical protein
MPFRWRVVAYASGLALLVAIGALWFWVLRDVNAPMSSIEGVSTPARPSRAECADLIAELARSPGTQHVTPDLRDRLRHCLDRR